MVLGLDVMPLYSNHASGNIGFLKMKEFQCKQNKVVMRQEINRCEECKSDFFIGKSPMENLCPECSHVLYGSANCLHVFENNNCIKCGWNGKASKFIEKLLNNSPQHTK